MNSKDTSNICNTIFSNLTTKKRKVINIPITNLNVILQQKKEK